MVRMVWEELKTNIWFYILLFFAIGLLIAGLIIPPPGVIDPSVLKGVGEIFAFGVLGTVIKAIDSGLDARLKHGDTTLTLGNLDGKENNNEEEEANEE